MLLLHMIVFCLVGTFNFHCLSETKLQTRCPPAWLAFEDHCYLYVREAKTFNEAETHCMSLSKPRRSAHLVSVENQQENNFMIDCIQAIGTGDFWIGFTDQQSEDLYTWTDGTSSQFTNWDTNQPNNAERNQHCAYIKSNGKWNNKECSSLKSYMCKKNGFKISCLTL